MTRWPIPAPMRLALEEAQAAAERGEVPVGAVVARGQEIIARSGNLTRTATDPTAHAEIVAIRSAASLLGQERLGECDLYVTLEPCAMCAGAIVHARIARLYYAASDSKGGGVEHGARVFEHPQCLHRPEVYAGMGDSEATALLKAFFQARR